VARRAADRVRRASHLVLYWGDGAMVVYNYATGEAAEATPDICAVLDYCGEWRTAADIAAHLGIARDLAAAFTAALSARGLVVRAGARPDVRVRAMDVLHEWNPAAGFFHTATKQVRFLSPREAAVFLDRRVRQTPMPAPIKRLRGAAVVRLPPPEIAGEFPRVLLARRTWRRFGSAPVAAADLATVLGLSLGVQQWLPTALGALPLKTAPSGGARHAIEGYVCVRRVAGIAPGLYHYASDVHRLERIRAGDMTGRLRQWMPHSGYFARAGFVLLLTAVLERQTWRYPYARAYRAALAEAGHVCQTFCLAATWRQLAPFCLMGLDDRAIEADLGIDGVRETVLYAAGAGTRPRGVRWAPRPRGSIAVTRNKTFPPG
jgi:SagB-type dehydrogenase family enzyme